MLNREYPQQGCSTARALELIGERWTLLVVRDVFIGIRRFDQIQEDLGVARNVLASRLDRLVEEGILERRPYSTRPRRDEYFLTEKGIDLWPVLVTMMRWGDEHGELPGGPPVVVLHKGCGGHMDDHFTCARCGERMGPRDAQAVPGPGATPLVTERLERRGREREPVASAG